MPLLTQLERDADAVEMMDRPSSAGELAGALEAITQLNRFFGGCRLTLRHVRHLLAPLPADKLVTMLDVGAAGEGALDLTTILIVELHDLAAVELHLQTVAAGIAAELDAVAQRALHAAERAHDVELALEDEGSPTELVARISCVGPALTTNVSPSSLVMSTLPSNATGDAVNGIDFGTRPPS